MAKKVKEVRAYTGIPFKAEEYPAPMIVDDEFISLNNVSSADVRVWNMAGICFKVVFYPVKENKLKIAMQEYYHQLNELLDEKLGPNRSSRCLIPQEDGTYQVCPKKRGDNRCACKDCPDRGKLEREDKAPTSYESLVDEFGQEVAPTVPSAEDVALEGMLLQDLLQELHKINPVAEQIVTLLYSGEKKAEIFKKLGIKKSRGYEAIGQAEDLVKKILFE
ncbi:MAG: hypothetical protein LUI10_04705 [Lachnospiraceae bacterium]|nr:hypothetical protein [Lachnospiraceae bacterium]